MAPKKKKPDGIMGGVSPAMRAEHFEMTGGGYGGRGTSTRSGAFSGLMKNLMKQFSSKPAPKYPRPGSKTPPAKGSPSRERRNVEMDKYNFGKEIKHPSDLAKQRFGFKTQPTEKMKKKAEKSWDQAEKNYTYTKPSEWGVMGGDPAGPHMAGQVAFLRSLGRSMYRSPIEARKSRPREFTAKTRKGKSKYGPGTGK